MNLRDKILSSNDVKTVKVHVPEWDADVTVRTMTAGQRARYEIRVGKDAALAVPLLLVYTLCDDSGKLLFTEDDINAVAEKNPAALYPLAVASNKLNMINVDDVEVAEKN